jgi:hypothetical protein
MKCEPHGTLSLDIKNGKRFGLQNAFKMQLISNLIISKHASLAKAIFICLKIPIIQKSKKLNLLIQNHHYFKISYKIKNFGLPSN